MSTVRVRLDDDVRALLEEIAADPRSRILRSPAPREVRAILPSLPDAKTLARRPAEGQLWRAYREQVAYWLGGLVHEIARTDPAVTSNGVRTLNLLGFEVPSGAAERLSRLEVSHFAERLDPGDRQLLASLGVHPSYTALTALARRLRPSEGSENLHGWALTIEGPAEEAAAILSGLRDRSENSTVRYFAAVNLNYAQYTLGDLKAAIEAQLLAIEEVAEPSLLAGLMLNASLLGEGRLARLGAAWLEEVASPTHPSIIQLCSVLENRSLGSADAASLRPLIREGGPVVRRICDAALD